MERAILEENKKNDLYIQILGILLLMPIMIQFSHTFFNQRGVADVSKITTVIYIAVLFYVIVKIGKFIVIDDLMLLLLSYSPFLVNYMIFEETRTEMTETSMIILYMFFLPTCVFAVLKIRDWQNFSKATRPFAIVGIITGLILIVFLDFEEYLVYMEFSYALLPLIAIMYNSFRYNEDHKLFNFALCLIGVIEILVFGARAPILFLLIYICLFELFNPKVKFLTKLGMLFFLLPSLLTIPIWAAPLFRLLGGLPIFEDSRIFEGLLSGNFFESESRDYIYFLCQQRLSSMGMEVTGFFGDRPYCGSVYPHNFIYEVLMSYGWILGIIALAVFAFLIIKAYFRNKENRVIVIFFVMTLLCRFWISGTYIAEGKFYIFLFAIIALTLSNKESEDRQVVFEE